jgi:hypothetical protein
MNLITAYSLLSSAKSPSRQYNSIEYQEYQKNCEGKFCLDQNIQDLAKEILISEISFANS